MMTRTVQEQCLNRKGNHMSASERSDAGPSVPHRQNSNGEIAHLVGEVFETAPAVEQAQLLEHLLRPLGVLSLVAVANGVFAKVLFQNPGRDLHVRLEDVQGIHASDVVALADFAQQVSIEAFDGLANLLSAWPTMAGSAAAVLLITILVRRSRSRRVSVDRFDDAVPSDPAPHPSGNGSRDEPPFLPGHSSGRHP